MITNNNQIKTSLNSLSLSNDSNKIVNSPCVFLRYLQRGGHYLGQVIDNHVYFSEDIIRFFDACQFTDHFDIIVSALMNFDNRYLCL
ncbi:hypothetical protein M153_6350001572 [Pseudoloma neurophilia]|uniref:Uncharacterized protein n=1 Tax=Pseudoloma neurophilia TaxID=146866 RepID=A0A0R0LWH1_9MICR|nr:hypothetical protein M153_6350001572 [Pseudoloma neurophilia]